MLGPIFASSNISAGQYLENGHMVPKSHFSASIPALNSIGHFPQEIDSKIDIYIL